MQRLANDLVGDVRTVEIAGVDMVDPARHGGAQDGECGGAVLGWPEDARAGKLHRAVTQTVHGVIAQWENAGGGDVGHVDLQTAMAPIWSYWHCAITQHNLHGLYEMTNNGTRFERPLRLRPRGASRRISRCRAFGWRLRIQPQRGGTAAGGETRRPPVEPYNTQHRPDRGGCPPAGA